MKTAIRRFVSTGTIAVAILLLVDAGRVAAQDAQLQMILERLEKLEKENRELRGTVQSQQVQLESQQRLLQQFPMTPPDSTLPAQGAGAVAPAPVRRIEED